MSYPSAPPPPYSPTTQQPGYPQYPPNQQAYPQQHPQQYPQQHHQQQPQQFPYGQGGGYPQQQYGQQQNATVVYNQQP